MGNDAEVPDILHALLLSLFLVLCLTLLLALGRCLVALVQAVDDVLGDVELLVGIQEVVTGFRQDEVILLRDVVLCQEVVQRVTQGFVELLRLVGQLTLQTGLQGLQVALLTLDGSLLALSLLTAGESVVVQFLLEVVNGSLQQQIPLMAQL